MCHCGVGLGGGHLQPITRKGEGHELGGRGWQEGDSAEEVFEGEHDGGHYERKNYLEDSG